LRFCWPSARRRRPNTRRSKPNSLGFRQTLWWSPAGRAAPHSSRIISARRNRLPPRSAYFLSLAACTSSPRRVLRNRAT